jgi:hypothetical protein
MPIGLGVTFDLEDRRSKPTSNYNLSMGTYLKLQLEDLELRNSQSAFYILNGRFGSPFGLQIIAWKFSHDVN